MVYHIECKEPICDHVRSAAVIVNTFWLSYLDAFHSISKYVVQYVRFIKHKKIMLHHRNHNAFLHSGFFILKNYIFPFLVPGSSKRDERRTPGEQPRDGTGAPGGIGPDPKPGPRGPT